MPLYDFQCGECGKVQAWIRTFEDRERPVACPCGGSAEYQFPVSAALGFRPFESFYCEPLDCDVHGKREWAQILKSEGIQEKGERAGIRNEEKSQYATRVEKQPPIGRSYADLQREKVRIRKLGPEIERQTDLRTVGQEEA